MPKIEQGDFIWYELMTTDLAAAEDFYAKVVGWDSYDPEHPGMEYHILKTDHGEVAGAMALSDEMTASGARPCWMGYVAVDDVDASAKAIEAAGGRIHVEPTDIPDVGRFAFIADPQGVMIYIMKSEEETSVAFAESEPRPGHCAWNELATTDQDAAMAFYMDQFGWKHDGDMDMGPMGQYKFLRYAKKGSGMIGAVMPKPAEMPMAMWTYYFRVPGIDAAVETIKSNGGQVLNGPNEIPGGDFMINAVDPQGAMFSLVGAR